LSVSYVRPFFSFAYRLLAGQLGWLLPISLFRRVLPEPMLCFCYHLVSDVPVPHVKHYNFLGTAEFEQDLTYLESQFNYLSYEQIVERRSRPEKIPETSVCLTFDDGFAECVSVVRPILLRRGAPCIFFIVTDLIDNHTVFFETRVSLCVDAILRRPIGEIATILQDIGIQNRLHDDGNARLRGIPEQMARKWTQFDERLKPILIWLFTIEPKDSELLDQLCRRLKVDAEGYVKNRKPYLSKEQILQLRSDGFTIGAHSCSHPRLQNLSLEHAEREIVNSCRIIGELTGQASVPFAFPYFGGGLDRTWLADIRKRYPFVGLFFDTQGLRPDVPMVIQRIFGERIEEAGPIDRILRRAWLRKFI
jgi:peptidoglycan/xylan/chitin deacetylase (PgdA/CDA1 family)